MGEFALEGRVSLVDLMPMHLTPTRQSSLGSRAAPRPPLTG